MTDTLTPEQVAYVRAWEESGNEPRPAFVPDGCPWRIIDGITMWFERGNVWILSPSEPVVPGNRGYVEIRFGSGFADEWERFHDSCVHTYRKGLIR